MPKVLVTGASGFVGSHIADELSANNFDVVLFDRIKSNFQKPNQTFVQCDLLDRALLNNILQGIDYVYHYGGIADIDTANKIPAETLQTNIMGTVNLVEAALKNNVKRFMFASTVYVHSEMGGFYAASKKACESIIENYGKTFGLDYTILRYGSLYGSRTNEKNGCYRIVKGILENDTFKYNGTGEELREYINILDAAKISVQCIDEKYSGECLILTGSEKMRIKDLIEMVKEITQRDTKIEYTKEVNSLHYNITPYNYAPKLGKKIVNNPHIDMGQGILELVKEIANKENNEHYMSFACTK